MLNMERMVGTITPKKVFSFRGPLLGMPWLDSCVVFVSAPPQDAVVIVKPHTPEVIRGVRSFDMMEEVFFPTRPVKKKKGKKTRTDTQSTIILRLSLMRKSFVCFVS